MRYYQSTAADERRLSVEIDGGTYDLTTSGPALDWFGVLLRAADEAGLTPDAYVEDVLDEATAVEDVPGTLREPVDAD